MGLSRMCAKGCSETEPKPSRGSCVAITNVRVFDGDKICEPSIVIIKGELIGSSEMVPTETVDAQGGVLLPGLIDCHIHLTGTDDLVRMTEYGVTTAFDMATWPAELLKSLRGQKGLTDIKACGLPAIGPGSSHTHMPGMPKEAVISNPEEAKKFVEDRVAEEADYIKLVSDTPGPDQESINALVRTAHDKGKVVFAHAVNLEATRMAQMAGVDIITHAPLDGVMSDDEVRQMVENKRISVPTLIMLESVCQMKGIDQERPGFDFANALKTVTVLHHAGVPVLAGTDANNVPGRGIPHGTSLHQELEFLVSCGLSTKEALQSATSLPAHYFGLKDRGVIKPGYRADLVLIDGNPIDDIKATRSIKKVWVAGQEFVPSTTK